MGILKWIGGAFGFATAGPLGGFLGFAIGTLIDDAVNGSRTSSAQYENSDPRKRNDFLFSLLVLASNVITADGKIMHSEMEWVRTFFRNNFGVAAAKQANDILLKLFEAQKQRGLDDFHRDIIASCHQLRDNLSESDRLQLLYFLVGLSKSDQVVTQEEIRCLTEMAYEMGLDPNEVISMLNYEEASGESAGQSASQSSQLEAAYKVLGVPSTATNDEVKAAYRKMALKHHPDRVATLGEDVRKAAERKFQEINEAKERVYKSRGMN